MKFYLLTILELIILLFKMCDSELYFFDNYFFYEGKLKDNKLIDGCIYTNKFKLVYKLKHIIDDLYEGKEYYNQNEVKYIGKFKISVNNNLDIKYISGIYFFRNDINFKGTFINNKFNEGVLYLSDGCFINGKFVNIHYFYGEKYYPNNKLKNKGYYLVKICYDLIDVRQCDLSSYFIS